MCGIAGMFAAETQGAGSSQTNILILQRMLETIHNRGPDGSGIHLEQGVGIGSVRLSIID